MKAYEKLSQRGKMHRLRRMAEDALGRYGLRGGCLSLQAQDEATVFMVSFTDEVDKGTARCHPYLGKLAGRSFLLRMRAASEANEAVAYAELVLLAALCRDTDLDVPEPVPACDGSLVTEVSADGVPGPRYCSVLCPAPGYNPNGKQLPSMMGHADSALRRILQQAELPV